MTKDESRSNAKSISLFDVAAAAAVAEEEVGEGVEGVTFRRRRRREGGDQRDQMLK